MLSTLRIKNLALVDDLTLELPQGYSVITGETGAGKSIIIGALKLILGERADRTLLRAGADSCVVEAAFDVQALRTSLASFLDESGLEPCEDGQLVIKRVFTAAGSNRQFVNGSPATLATLTTLGDWLVDMHGPHDHQSLLKPARQLDILDAYGEIAHTRNEFAQLVRERAHILEQREALIVDDTTYAQQLDLLRFQVDEIDKAALDPEDEVHLEEEYQRAGNAARLLELGHAIHDQLVEQDDSLLSQAGQVARQLQELAALDPATADFLQEHQQAVEMLGEVVGSISNYLDRVEVDPARLQELEERLNLVQSLKRKYGATVSEILAFGEEARKRLAGLEHQEEELERLSREQEAIESKLRQLGQRLSRKRRAVIPKLCDDVSRQLQHLGFKASRLDIDLQSAIPGVDQVFPAIRSSGFDSVEFQFAPNPGEPARALRAIASSGELARVMLALKTVLAVEDEVPVLVFDEVDANVGGETAHAVGEKMKHIAVNRQVLCITHLPQVAAPAGHHYVVSKETTRGRTLSRINPVSGEARVQELSRMLGGTSDAATQHAVSMLNGKS
jgi:DNA repair protein RecN (Recombination protein N)